MGQNKKADAGKKSPRRTSLPSAREGDDKISRRGKTHSRRVAHNSAVTMQRSRGPAAGLCSARYIRALRFNAGVRLIRIIHTYIYIYHYIMSRAKVGVTRVLELA